MQTVIVVNDPRDWGFKVPGVEVVPASSYLAGEVFSRVRRFRVFNLCRSYRYQSDGYYVSLLAEARGHAPIPSVTTIQDLKNPELVRVLSEDLVSLIQRSLAPLQSDDFVLSVYFGRNVARRYDRLAGALSRLFEAPLLRARFAKVDDEWRLKSVGIIGSSDVPAEHADFVNEAGSDFFKRRRRNRREKEFRYDLGILWDPKDPTSPSDETAIRRFRKAGENLGMRTEILAKEDYPHLAEFDALFIRETTAVHHHTYRFARRAEAEGLAVIDDPTSILRCTNKVYLAEILANHRLSTPKTAILRRGNGVDAARALGFPLILKQPDSSFSEGVWKVDDERALEDALPALLERSSLVIAQEFLPTPFDWRVGVLEGKPLYVCKYFMASRHWQIVKRVGARGAAVYGATETLPVDEAPPSVVRAALKAARLVGAGLYGVDIKQAGRRAFVIEINDNPTIEGGVEDAASGREVYERIMEFFLGKIEKRRGAPAGHGP